MSSIASKEDTPEIYFAGHTMCSDYHAELLRALEGREVCINLISKSGTTLESAIAFRLLRSFMEKKYLVAIKGFEILDNSYIYARKPCKLL